MIFDRYWKPMSLASLLILVVSLMILAGNVASTGFPMERDVELTGGKRVSFITDNIDIGKVEDAFPGYEVRLYRGTENRSEEHTSELQSHDNFVCRLLLEK